MLRGLVLGLWAVATLSFAHSALANVKTIPSIDSHELAELMAGEPNLLLIDFRSTESFTHGHLPFAVSLPWDKVKTNLTALVSGPPRPIVVYGGTTLELVHIARLISESNTGRVAVYPGGLTGWTSYEAGYLEIEWQGLWRLLTRENPLVLDFRDNAAWAAGHIPGAISGEIDSSDEVWKAWAQAGRPIITYCSTICGASRTAAKRLAEKGVRPVYQFPGGYEEWADATAALEGN